jgi:hypothetical protein
MRKASVGTKNNTTGYVVPADDKENARVIISEIILGVLKGLKMVHAKPSVKRRRELYLIRERFVK